MNINENRKKKKEQINVTMTFFSSSVLFWDDSIVYFSFQMASSTESETNQISSDEHLTQIIDEDTNTDESPTLTTSRMPGQTAIGAKLVKKLETLGISSKLFIRKFFSSSR